MKIATFNINGIKARHVALCDWLDESQPDVALLQEIKSVDENFPRELFEERMRVARLVDPANFQSMLRGSYGYGS